jgi:hypothetical protein
VTIETVATTDRKWTGDAVAGAEFRHRSADGHDFARELVAHDRADVQAGLATVVNVQVRAANAGAENADDGISRGEERRVGDGFAGNLFDASKDKGLHLQ